MVVNALASVATAAAVTLLVRIQANNWANDRLYTSSYVPKRSRNTSQFLQWLKSKAKSVFFDPLDRAVYGIRVSRTRASRLSRRCERAFPLTYALLILAVIPFMPFRYARTRASPPAHLDRPFDGRSQVPTAFCASADEEPRALMSFDVDSYPILVDNGASHSFTNCKADYVAPPKPFHRRIHGLKTGHASHIGTVSWSWATDDGKIVTEIIPNVLLCKDLPYRMLSPQHWAQAREDYTPRRDGTRCVTDADAVVLEWDQQTHRRTIPLIPGAQNVGLMRSAVVTPRRFTAFCALLDGTGVLPLDTELPHCFHAHVIPQDDEDKASTASEGATNESSAATSAPSASEGEQLGATVGASSTRTSPAYGDSHGDTHASTSASTATEAPRTTPILVEFGLEDLPDMKRTTQSSSTNHKTS
jgi:hypothetical protein